LKKKFRETSLHNSAGFES